MGLARIGRHLAVTLRRTSVCCNSTLEYWMQPLPSNRRERIVIGIYMYCKCLGCVDTSAFGRPVSLWSLQEAKGMPY